MATGKAGAAPRAGDAAAAGAAAVDAGGCCGRSRRIRWRPATRSCSTSCSSSAAISGAGVFVDQRPRRHPPRAAGQPRRITCGYRRVPPRLRVQQRAAAWSASKARIGGGTAGSINPALDHRALRPDLPSADRADAKRRRGISRTCRAASRSRLGRTLDSICSSARPARSSPATHREIDAMLRAHGPLPGEIQRARPAAAAALAALRRSLAQQPQRRRPVTTRCSTGWSPSAPQPRTMPAARTCFGGWRNTPDRRRPASR